MSQQFNGVVCQVTNNQIAFIDNGLPDQQTLVAGLNANIQAIPYTLSRKYY